MLPNVLLQIFLPHFPHEMKSPLIFFVFSLSLSLFGIYLIEIQIVKV